MNTDEGHPGRTMILYHQTDQNSAELILVSQKMIRGGSGSLGGGIYFALTPESTNRKAHHTGVTLSARVTVGKSKVVQNQNDLDNFTHTQLKAAGYDSVLGKCFYSGDEYVVYNFAQVTDIKIVNSVCPIFAQKYAKVACPFGANCTRKNPDHKRDFIHPGDPSGTSQCKYGNNCYRANPDHIKQCHPPGYQPKPNPKKAANGSCSYGTSCYRQNPDHIRLCHPPGFTPALNQ